MASAIMQLHARGSQDIATIVNPEVTFWKTVYPRHTNFAWDDTIITQSTGTADYGQLVEFKLPRSGDLVTKCTLFVEMGKVTENALWKGEFSPFIKDFGRALIDYVELTIGGYQIERITGDMLHILDLISRPDYQSHVENMPTHHGGSIKFNADGTVDEQYDNSGKQFLYIPLEFSFTRDPGLALPMISLQYHEVRVKVKFSSADKIFTNFSLTTPATTTTWNSKFQSSDNDGLRQLIRSLYLRGIYGNEMSQYNMEFGDLSLVNYVIDNAVYTNKITDLDITNDYDIQFKIAGVPYVAGTLFTIPHALVPDAEKYTAASTPSTTIANQKTVWVASPPQMSVRLMCRYIYLDDFERRQFAVNTHEYLMTEYQHHQHFVTAGVDQVSIDLKFNHPTKELIFFFRPDEWWTDDDLKSHYTGYWSFANPNSAFGDGHLFSTANLVLNSQNVYGDGRDPVYFSSLLPSHFHNRAWKDHRLYIIPFSLQPDAWKPTGSINLSRLDDVKLVLKRTGPLPPGCIHVYARNFNVIKIQNGMGGKRYAS
eukprot:jgi/Mesvir1/21648/Mv04069-RA.1